MVVEWTDHPTISSASVGYFELSAWDSGEWWIIGGQYGSLLEDDEEKETTRAGAKAAAEAALRKIGRSFET